MGAEYTRRHVFLYTVGLTLVTFVPYLIGMSGLFYLAAAVVLDSIFLGYAWLVWRDYSDAVARAQLPLVDLLPGAAVRRPAARSLPAVLMRLLLFCAWRFCSTACSPPREVQRHPSSRASIGAANCALTGHDGKAYRLAEVSRGAPLSFSLVTPSVRMSARSPWAACAN
jgi:hypothetical protein